MYPVQSAYFWRECSTTANGAGHQIFGREPHVVLVAVQGGSRRRSQDDQLIELKVGKNKGTGGQENPSGATDAVFRQREMVCRRRGEDVHTEYGWTGMARRSSSSRGKTRRIHSRDASRPLPFSTNNTKDVFSFPFMNPSNKCHFAFEFVQHGCKIRVPPPGPAILIEVS